MSQHEIDREIRVLGQMRSGNHAIIRWIMGMYPEQRVCFLNNVAHGPGSPYLTSRRVELSNLDPDVAPSDQPADVVVYSYEDSKSLQTEERPFLSSVLRHTDDVRRHLGPSTRKVDVLIIRDPFNGFASRLKLLRRRGPLGGVDDMATVRDIWKETARFALSDDHGFTIVKYNDWVDSAAYRASLSADFEPDAVPRLSNHATRYGGGSSFQDGVYDRLSLKRIVAEHRKILDPNRLRKAPSYLRRLFKPTTVDHKAVHQRWRHFTDDDVYRDLFSDPEVSELSEALFGEIPGTRSFVASV